MHPALSLQKALIARLRGDAALIGLLGGAHVYDRPPRRAPLPYVALHDIETRAWDRFDRRGHEHKVTFHVWTENGGRRQAYEIIARMDELLDDADLTLTGHHLVNLRTIFWTALQARRERLFQGVMRLRATTEPVA